MADDKMSAEEMIGVLRDFERGDWSACSVNETAARAADLITALQRKADEARAEASRLRGALEPFIRVHSVGFEERNYADTDAIYRRILTTEPDKNCSLTAGDLRRARAAYESATLSTPAIPHPGHPAMTKEPGKREVRLRMANSAFREAVRMAAIEAYTRAGIHWREHMVLGVTDAASMQLNLFGLDDLGLPKDSP